MKNVVKPLANSVLVHLELTVAASATDATVQKKMLQSEKILIISDKEINNIMKRVKYLEEFGSLIKGVSKTIKNKAE